MQEYECAILRGGTSKGVFFKLDQLPHDRQLRNEIIHKIVGEDSHQIDGLGGGHPLSSKVALVSQSAEEGVDIDYHFVQVIPGRGIDDTIPCGNMLSAVGIFACEVGLIKATSPTTTVVVRDKNTMALIEQVIQTPEGKVDYAGDVVLAGIDRPAAPVLMRYKNIVSHHTGKLWPTGQVLDVVDGIPVSLIDAAIPVMIVPMESVGLPKDAGLRVMHERQIIDLMLDLRSTIAKRAELAKSNSVPKIAAVSEGKAGVADLAVRYFTPYNPHRSLAVTGAISLAVAMAEPGSVAHSYAGSQRQLTFGKDEVFKFEHVSGVMEFKMELEAKDQWHAPVHADLIRSARMIMRGTTYCPE